MTDMASMVTITRILNEGTGDPDLGTGLRFSVPENASLIRLLELPDRDLWVVSPVDVHGTDGTHRACGMFITVLPYGILTFLAVGESGKPVAYHELP